MLILILIGVQHLQNVAFSFEKGLKGQNHSSDFHHPIKKSHQQNDPILSHLGRREPPYPLMLFGKPCMGWSKDWKVEEIIDPHYSQTCMRRPLLGPLKGAHLG